MYHAVVAVVGVHVKELFAADCCCCCIVVVVGGGGGGGSGSGETASAAADVAYHLFSSCILF